MDQDQIEEDSSISQESSCLLSLHSHCWHLWHQWTVGVLEHVARSQCTSWASRAFRNIVIISSHAVTLVLLLFVIILLLGARGCQVGCFQTALEACSVPTKPMSFISWDPLLGSSDARGYLLGSQFYFCPSSFPSILPIFEKIQKLILYILHIRQVGTAVHSEKSSSEVNLDDCPQWWWCNRQSG